MNKLEKFLTGELDSIIASYSSDDPIIIDLKCVIEKSKNIENGVESDLKALIDATTPSKVMDEVLGG